MKTLFKKTSNLVALSLVFGFFACSHEDVPATIDSSMNESTSFLVQRNAERINIFKGPVVAYGSGKARSWISINSEGYPVEIGMELTADVFDDLSLLESDQELTITTVLPLHHKAKELTPFEHIGLNYQPHGHAPVYFAEHFDFHFYTITNEERMAMPDYDANNQTIVDAYNYFPDMTKMPSDYFKLPGQLSVIPKMGKHWLPLDWQTGYNPFEHIMFFGTYDQKSVFIEPMITVAYLLSGNEFGGNYSQPQTFEEPGNNYPTKYNIYHDNASGKIYISLSDFVRR